MVGLGPSLKGGIVCHAMLENIYAMEDVHWWKLTGAKMGAMMSWARNL